MTSGIVADAPTSDVPPVIDGRYQVVRELGRGAMGVVYQVHDRASDRDLALKQVLAVPETTREGRADRSTVRFRREFHTVAGLCHPCVVEVYEYGIDRGRPYYTMELLEGPTLRDLLGAPVERCIRLLRGIASALAFLHSRRLLHRDLKARNVRCDADGRPKLLDFGVLATMGVVGDVAGTPPGIPPEAVRGLPLDGRADLYGLGTLAYRLLTGRQAFGAESVAELEALWQRAPERPIGLRPELPVALDELVMALLRVEVTERPGSAAEVIARLDAIGGLERTPELEVAQGWLKSARLVGRDPEIRRVRAAIDRLAEGRGAMLVLEGPAGVGKTRILREAGLHAQIAGATVLRGRGRGAGPVPYELARQLLRELERTCPREARELGRPYIEALRRVFPELGRGSSGVPVEPAAPEDRGEPPVEERLRIQGALLAWFLAVADRRRLVVLVDELERSDEGSAALLAALGHRAPEHALVVVGARRSDAEPASPLAALRGVGESVRLAELERPAVAELVRDWFGDMPGSARLVDWIHHAAGGSPLHCFELARHLCEQGVVLYTEGIWRLVAEPDEIELPAAMADTMDLRIEALSPTGRSLSQALALWKGVASVEICAELLASDDLGAIFEALDELVYEEIIVGGDEGFELAHEGVRDALLRSLAPGQAEGVHLRVAALITARWGAHGGERGGDLGWHLLRGGRRREGAAQLERIGRRHFEVDSFEDAIAPLEAALAVYDDHAEPEDELRALELRALLVRAGVVADRATALCHADRALDGFGRRGGLALARRLTPALGRRLGSWLALSWAHLRWWSAGSRGPSPKRALVVTVTLANYLACVWAISFDPERLERLRERCDPLRALGGPVGEVATQMLDALAAIGTGRWSASLGHFERVLAAFVRLEDGVLAAVDRRMLAGATYILRALVRSVEQLPGFERALERLRELETPFFALGAQMCRVYDHQLRGEEPQAQRLLRQTELAAVQLGRAWIYDVVQAWVSVLVYGLTGDVVRLRRVADELERFDQGDLRLRAFLVLARAELARAQGDGTAARSSLERALERLHPSQWLQRLALRAVLVDVLLERGEVEAAVRASEPTRGEAPPGVGLRPTWIRLRCSRAVALARAGRLEDAADAVDALLSWIEQAESQRLAPSALLCGLIHETGAAVFEIRGDEPRRRRHVTQAELLFSSTGNPVLIARARRLVERSTPRDRARSHALDDAEHSQVSDIVDTIELEAKAGAGSASSVL